MEVGKKPPEVDEGDEAYYDPEPKRDRVFDASVLQEPLTALPVKPPIVMAPSNTVSEAMEAMQRERRGCVLVTEDGSDETPLAGIFTERDVLQRVMGKGRNPATLALDEVMTRDPETLPADARIAWILNMMALGGFRHVPAVDEKGRPAFIVSVRDVVEFLVDFFPRDVLNMPPDFGTGRFRSREGA